MDHSPLAILFDRDGVLIDSEWVNIEAGRKAFETLGITLTEEDCTHIAGRPPQGYLPYFQNKYTFDTNLFQEIQPKIYYDLFAQAPLFTDMISLVLKLKSFYKVGLVTGSDRYSTDIFLQKAGLYDVFDTIVTLDMYQHTKPDPESYLLGAKNLAIPPHQCIAIEDSERGLQAAKNAGMRCIVIPNKQTEKQDFSQADAVVSSAQEITFDLINSL